MKTIEEIQTEFVTAFNEIDDWMMQYEFLLQIGAELETYPEEYRDEQHLIQGCQSKVWIYGEKQNGKIHIWGDSEALIIKGMIAVAIMMFQDQRKEDIEHAKVWYLTDTDLKNQISVDRFHGVNSVISYMQSL